LVQNITVDHCAGVSLPCLKFVILRGQKAPEVFASTDDLVLDAVVQETLDAGASFADSFRIISIVTLEVNLCWNWWNDARQVFYLQSLNQPLQIAIPSVDLNERKLRIVLELSKDFV